MWRGVLFDIFHALKAHVNFTYEVTSDEKIWGLRDAAGNWNGMIGKLVENRSDIAIARFTITNARRQVNNNFPTIIVIAYS